MIHPLMKCRKASRLESLMHSHSLHFRNYDTNMDRINVCIFFRIVESVYYYIPIIIDLFE